MDLGNRWASCSDDGSLNFHWKAMQLPFKYHSNLVAHEVAHIIENYHRLEFWQALERLMPEYEEYQSGLIINTMKYFKQI